MDTVQYEVMTDNSGTVISTIPENNLPITSTDSQTLAALAIEHTTALNTIKTLEAEVTKYKLMILTLENQASAGSYSN